MASQPVTIPLASWRVETPRIGSAAREALRHLERSVREIGGAAPAAAAPVCVRLARIDARRPLLDGWDLGPSLAPLAGWQRDQCYAIVASPDAVTVAARTDTGLAFGLAELEMGLRAAPARLELPARRRFTAPAIEERGEYLNVGYDIAGITPHQWGSDRWRQYIDRLALARLNRLYLFLWGSDVTAWRESALSRSPPSRRLYREIPGAVRYARSRGISTTLMLSPTMVPRDVWKAHPEWHADIDYVRAGFPVVCPNHPGAWRALLGALDAHVRALRGVDAVQIWFYDPGGCWCEARGCRAGQAASLARQAVAFARRFRAVNPRGRVEVNLWPIALWERTMGAAVRDELSRRLMDAWPEEYRRVTIVGTPEEGPTPTPLRERDLGFRTGLFLFATNPESGYAFLTPHLRYVPWAARVARDFRVNACFGHRLEVWSRAPATHWMADWLWDPDREPAEVVRAWADRQCGDPGAGAELAEAITKLDALTDDGLDPVVAEAMVAALERAWSATPEVCRAGLTDLRATITAVGVLGRSARLTDSDARTLVEQFAEALRRSPTFAPLAEDAAGTFARYRGLLMQGWRKRMF